MMGLGKRVRRIAGAQLLPLGAALARVLAGADEAWGTAFVFWQLADGAYQLVVETQGYRTYRVGVQVQTGKGAGLAPIVMQRER